MSAVDLRESPFSKANLQAFSEGGGNAISAVLNTVSKIKDAKQRQQFQENFAYLTKKEVDALADKLQAAKTQNEKLIILAAAFKDLFDRRAANINEVVYRNELQNRKKQILLISLFVALSIGIVLIVGKK